MLVEPGLEGWKEGIGEGQNLTTIRRIFWFFNTICNKRAQSDPLIDSSSMCKNQVFNNHLSWCKTVIMPYAWALLRLVLSKLNRPCSNLASTRTREGCSCRILSDKVLRMCRREIAWAGAQARGVVGSQRVHAVRAGVRQHACLQDMYHASRSCHDSLTLPVWSPRLDDITRGATLAMICLHSKYRGC